jgi:mannobiose 2-epimerase
MKEIRNDHRSLFLMQHQLQRYKRELQRELENILQYWMKYAPDDDQGGFYGKIDEDNLVHPEAEKGVVLNARILWSFAAAYTHTKKSEYLVIAKRAYHYILDHFMDTKYGGVYWSVDHRGEVSNSRKQIYGQAFCLYAFCEYYKAVREDQIADRAISLFNVVEKNSYDNKHKGYYEAWTHNWKPIDDFRLSAKDENFAKTMNTHLHLLEAYANLYSIWQDSFLGMQIENLLEVFAHHFIDSKTHHLILFFDERWTVKSDLISYGHEIEAAWLLQYAAEMISHSGWIITMKSQALKIAEAATEGWEYDGGLRYEKEPGRQNNEKHWWAQAEAMIGFYNAFQVSQQKKYLEQSLKSWEFVKKYIRDKKNGEWFWGVHEDNMVMKNQDKIGFWKCPYHNTRACLELINRIKVRSNPVQIVDLK